MASKQANQLAAGATVGMASLLVGPNGAACDWHKHDDAVAAERSLVAVVHKGHDLAALIEIVPELESVFMRTAKARLLRTFIAGLLGAPAASAQAQRRIVSIADKCTLKFSRPAQVICKQGERVDGACPPVRVTSPTNQHQLVPQALMVALGRRVCAHQARFESRPNPPLAALYIVVSGSVRAISAEQMKLSHEPRTVYAGHQFGEGALLMPNAVSDSTYRAATSGCTLLVVPRFYFYQLLDKDQTLLAALHVKLLRAESSLAAILTHPRTRSAFAGFLQMVCGDHFSLDAYESMHAYAYLAPAGLNFAARTVGESIMNDFLLDACPKPVGITPETRVSLLQNIVAARGLPVASAWPPDLFAAAEAELDRLIHQEYMPKFVAHPIFEHCCMMLGNYEAEGLFPPDKLSMAKQGLAYALEGDHTVTAAAEFSLSA